MRDQARKLMKLHDEGIVPVHIVTLFGLSGELPLPAGPHDRSYRTRAEKLFRERMQDRLGDRWREFMPRFRSDMTIPWAPEGF